MAVFPPGMLATTITLDAADFGIGGVRGVWSVEAETPVYWRGADAVLLADTPIPKASSSLGKASVTVAASTQPNMVGRGPAGEYSIPSRAYLFRFKANTGGAVYERWVLVPSSARPVALKDLPDLGGWPNLTPTGGGGSAGNGWVEIFPDVWAQP